LSCVVGSGMGIRDRILSFSLFSFDKYNELTYLEAKSIVVTLLPVFFFSQQLINTNDLERDLSLYGKAMLIGIIFYAVLKLSLVVFGFFFGVNTPEIYEIAFGLEPNKWEIIPGFYRAQYINDTVCIILFFIICPLYENESSRSKFYYLGFIAIWIIAVSSFSRLLISYCLFLTSLYLIRYLKIRMLFIIGLCFSALIVMYSDVLQSLIEVRLDNKYIAASDNERFMQFNCLFDAFSDNPIVGLGMGAYVKSCIRGGNGTEYLYEIQWLSFLMKYGIFGFIPFLMYYIYPVLLWRLIGALAVSSYLLFILSGLTNPYLLSSTTSVIFMGLILLCAFKRFLRDGAKSA
ncbi:O-antigen ligase family protein, partial [Aeromonas sp. MR16]|uniref:O-antigen ligase family protein n=1 Tax=Aeromonas sp. MR16 TaxID=2923420 RepID=UPI001F4B6DBD